MATEYLVDRYKQLEVVWLPSLDGGGRDTVPEFLVVVRKLIGKVGRLCEFCAGPSFIGFALLDAGLCDSLCLVDINPVAVEAMRETVRRNHLEDRVTIYESDGLSRVPATERWDLVVSNPPHFRAETTEEYKQDILRRDPGWSIQRKFLSEVSTFLQPHSSVLIQECYAGSDEKDFLVATEEGGLRLVDSFMFRKTNDQWRDVYYYLWLKPDHDNFIWSGSPVETVSLAVSDLQNNPGTQKLQSWRKYRFRVLNDVRPGLGVALLNGTGKNGRVVKVFSLEKLPVNAPRDSNIFYLTPGTYELTDPETAKPLRTLIVE